MKGIPDPLWDNPAEELSLVLCVEEHDEFWEGFKMRDRTEEHTWEFFVERWWEGGWNGITVLVRWIGDVWDIEDEEEVVDWELGGSRVGKGWKWFFRPTVMGSCSEGLFCREGWVRMNNEDVGGFERTRRDELFVGDDDGVPTDVKHDVKVGGREVLEMLVNACMERHKGWD